MKMPILMVCLIAVTGVSYAASPKKPAPDPGGWAATEAVFKERWAHLNSDDYKISALTHDKSPRPWVTTEEGVKIEADVAGHSYSLTSAASDTDACANLVLAATGLTPDQASKLDVAAVKRARQDGHIQATRYGVSYEVVHQPSGDWRCSVSHA